MPTDHEEAVGRLAVFLDRHLRLIGRPTAIPMCSCGWIAPSPEESWADHVAATLIAQRPWEPPIPGECLVLGCDQAATVPGVYDDGDHWERIALCVECASDYECFTPDTPLSEPS